MRTASDKTDRAEGEGKRRANPRTGAPVKLGKRPGTRGRLSSSRANSAEWPPSGRTARSGGGGRVGGWRNEAGENGSIQKLSRPALPAPEGPSPGRACRKPRVAAEGEEPRGSTGRGLPWPDRARPRSPLHT